jgi:hypothetical protein
MRGTGVEHRRDGGQQLGAFEEIGHRKRLLGEGAPTGETSKALDPAAARVGIAGVFLKAVSGLSAEVFGTLFPWAERRPELLQSLDGGAGPVHGTG